jgi:hypothetical protein
LGAKFFSQRTPGWTGDTGDEVCAAGAGLEARDRQQALVLDALRRAAGAPVSYGELREAGIEFPASVVSELELAGVAIERCFGEGRGPVGVRLDPASDRAARPMPDPAERPIPTGADERVWSRVLALTALLVGVAAACAFVLIWSPGRDRATRVATAKRPHSRLVAAAAGARPARAPQSTHPAPPVPVSPALATELEAQGHSLLEAGRYGNAVPVLKRAVLATGETLGACLEPASTTCLTYAYALYDLGRAVRLSGEPQAAVPILERRLQIDNQRPVVSDELQLARQGIG